MGTRLTIPTPDDYRLHRDACSYGYFLLEPNRWYPADRTLVRDLALGGGPTCVAIVQDDRAGSPLHAVFDRALARAERAEATRQISRMLSLNVGPESVAAFHAADPRWKKSGRGRLFRSPTMFEDVIKTVTSCNVAWTSTIIMNRRLCEVAGERSPDYKGERRSCTFPTARKLARTRPNTLRARCSVGYRDARIVELAKLFATPPSRGGLDVEWFEDPGTPDDAVREKLLDLPGVGPYAAANIMQLLGRYAHLPLDTESVRHGKTVLGFKGADAHVMKLVNAHFASFGRFAFLSYWFELWAFYEKLRGPSHTWDRETTGKTFTAAQMK